ncbi:hypothetical protein KKF73_02270, partial [Patescibacteria group bacterium]|nr:hypothetical protein [Patescibacteria group bacterium]
EEFLRKKYFKQLGLSFRKIRKDKKGNIPDGWILNSKNERIALAEIKLIKESFKDMKGGVMTITIDKTILNKIKKAKKQLKTIKTDLPKLIYFIVDDSFVSPRIIADALFGPWITIENEGKVIYDGPRGLNLKSSKKYQQDNKFKDDYLSGIVFYVSQSDSYKIWLFQNKNSVPIPQSLFDKHKLVELWSYENKPTINVKRIS